MNVYGRLLATLTLAGAMGGSAVAEGNWIPVIAELRQFHIHVAADGSEKVVEETRGVFRRASNGMEIQIEQPVVEGVEKPPATALVIDRTTGDIFQLVYRTKQAYLKHHGSPSPNPLSLDRKYLSKARSDAMAEKVVNGVYCHAFPVRGALEAKGRVSGTTWRSLDYDLRVRTESELMSDSGDGSKLRTIYELYNIQIGVEPEPEQVGIPQDFESITNITQVPVVNPRGCSTCKVP